MTENLEIEFQLIENNGQHVKCVACDRMPRHHPMVAMYKETPKSEPIFLCEDCLKEDDLDKPLRATVSHHEQEATYCEQGAEEYSTRAEKFRASAAHKRSLIGRIIKWPSREAWAIKCSERFLKFPGEFTWKGPAADLDDEIPF